MYTLLVTKGPDFGKSCEIRSGRLSVGTAQDMAFVLTDPTVQPRHFVVVFEEGGWKAITYAPDSTILIDRRWSHPQTRQRGARIFVGESQLLLFAGEIDLETAQSGARGLDMDAETLRDDALTKVRDKAYRFRHDMLGKAQPVSESDKGAKLLSADAAMLPLPAPEEMATVTDVPRAAVKGQFIRLSDTAISAMPSSSRDLVVLYDRDGDFASSIRILATKIEEVKQRLGYKSILVTSASDGEGKTVLASNLALAMSEDSERKVALVDANFRSPRLGDLFNLDPSRGLLAALSGERPLSECVARVLGRNLIVLQAGGEHKSPSSLLSSPKFKSLLAELYQAVDFMIVDAPSAIPYADVPLLTGFVDCALLAVASNWTPRSILDKAMDTVGRARVVGNIFISREKPK